MMKLLSVCYFEISYSHSTAVSVIALLKNLFEMGWSEHSHMILQVKPMTLYLSFPSQVFDIVRVRQGLVGSVRSGISGHDAVNLVSL